MQWSDFGYSWPSEIEAWPSPVPIVGHESLAPPPQPPSPMATPEHAGFSTTSADATRVSSSGHGDRPYIWNAARRRPTSLARAKRECAPPASCIRYRSIGIVRRSRASPSASVRSALDRRIRCRTPTRSGPSARHRSGPERPALAYSVMVSKFSTQLPNPAASGGARCGLLRRGAAVLPRRAPPRGIRGESTPHWPKGSAPPPLGARSCI